MTQSIPQLPDKRALLNAIADYGGAKEARNDGLTAQHFAKVCGLIDALASQPMAAIPEGMSLDFTDTARAALLSVLWHHQGASSPVGQPIRFALGMGVFDELNDHQISEAKRWESIAAAPQPLAGQQITAAPQGVGELSQIAAIMKYPEEWDTAVYPTLVEACDAMNHAAFCHADNQGFEYPPAALPPGRGMVPMTEEEITEVWRKAKDHGDDLQDAIGFTRDIEQFHGIKEGS